MKVRFKSNTKITGTASKFNTSSIGEVIMHFDDGSTDSVFIKDLEVFISKNTQFLLNIGVIPEWKPLGHWISMNEAFDNKDLITDNYNTFFFEPINNEEKERGYRLTDRDLAKLKAESFD